MRGPRIAFYTILIAAIILGAMFFSTVLSYLLVSFVFAYLVNPIVLLLQKNGFSRIWAIVTLYVVIAMFVAGTIVLVMPLAFKQSMALIDTLKVNQISADTLRTEVTAYVPTKADTSATMSARITHPDSAFAMTEHELLSADSSSAITAQTVATDSILKAATNEEKTTTAQKPVKHVESRVHKVMTTVISLDQLDNIGVVKQLRDMAQNLEEKIPFIHLTNYYTKVINKAKQFLANVPRMLMQYSGNILTAFSFIATVPFIGFFLLKDGHKFLKTLLRLVPNRYFELCFILIRRTDEIIGSYLRAMMFEVVAVSIMASIAMSIVGVHYGVAVGILAGFANMIPYFGPTIAIVFATIAVLGTGQPVIMVVYAALAMYIVQVIDNNLIYPIVVGKSTEMHPLIILLTVMAGGFAMGILGMFLAVPVVYLVYGIIDILRKSLKAFQII